MRVPPRRALSQLSFPLTGQGIAGRMSRRRERAKLSLENWLAEPSEIAEPSEMTEFGCRMHAAQRPAADADTGDRFTSHGSGVRCRGASIGTGLTRFAAPRRLRVKPPETIRRDKPDNTAVAGASPSSTAEWTRSAGACVTPFNLQSKSQSKSAHVFRSGLEGSRWDWTWTTRTQPRLVGRRGIANGPRGLHATRGARGAMIGLRAGQAFKLGECRGRDEYDPLVPLRDPGPAVRAVPGANPAEVGPSARGPAR